MKEEIKIRPFWYSDIWIFPKLITIITTLDKHGKVNAAPYSHIMQYDVMQKKPRIMLGMRQGSHTLTNIQDTGEFVINCPPFDYLDDMMDTARFYPEGVNELDNTRFTPIPSRKVKPPSLQECPQIMECTGEEINLLEKSSGIIIANTLRFWMGPDPIFLPPLDHEDLGLLDLTRPVINQVTINLGDGRTETHEVRRDLNANEETKS